MKKYFSEFGETPTMDNAEPTPVEVAWLAGVFDGEGSVLVHRAKNGKANHIYCGFHITNTDIDLLSKCQSILQRLIRRPVRLYRKKTYSRSLVKSNLECWTIDLRKRNELIKILTLLIPHLTSKLRKAKLVLEYLKFRDAEILRTGKWNSYEPESIAFANEIIKNWRGVTTEREALGNEMKPQSELYSNIQNPTEMIGSSLN